VTLRNELALATKGVNVDVWLIVLGGAKDLRDRAWQSAPFLKQWCEYASQCFDPNSLDKLSFRSHGGRSFLNRNRN
jgi:hypothetical protein